MKRFLYVRESVGFGDWLEHTSLIDDTDGSRFRRLSASRRLVPAVASR
jgi:hypothetical protein